VNSVTQLFLVYDLVVNSNSDVDSIHQQPHVYDLVVSSISLLFHV
jgi:hypothetical protein